MSTAVQAVQTAPSDSAAQPKPEAEASLQPTNPVKQPPVSPTKPTEPPPSSKDASSSKADEDNPVEKQTENSKLTEQPLKPPDATTDTQDEKTSLGSLPDVLAAESLNRNREAASEIGVKLQAKASLDQTLAGNPRTGFLADHQSFMNEIGRPFKLRRIGGAELDLFGLYKAVLERGGLQAVICTRAFKMVAQALELPKTCTSAAFILRIEYEKLLYMYEQKHVWNRDPQSAAPLYAVERSRRACNPFRHRLALPPPPPSPPPPPPPAPTAPAAVHPLQKPSTRPRRHAAVAASSAVAAAVSDDPYLYPIFPRRSRLTGLDEHSLTVHDEQLLEDQMASESAPHAVYIPNQPGERERVVAALWSPIHDDVAWALGTLNALSFDLRNLFAAQEFPGVLDALHEVLNRYMEDVVRARSFGVQAGMEEFNHCAPQDVPLSAMEVQPAGYYDTGPGVGVSHHRIWEDNLRSSTLQQYQNLFNLADPIAVDRGQCAVVASNVLRNMSFYDRNAIFLANSSSIMNISAVMIQTVQVPANLRDALMDSWINVSPYLNASPGCGGSAVLATCIKLLDPFNEGAELSRFTNCGEVLARLAASPERNEAAIVATFDEVLPRLVDMLGGRNRRYVNAGLAALCNFSAFDWPARDRIARTPRALERLVGMLPDAELAQRAALTLLNLAEAPNNRSVLMYYETRLVEYAISTSPAADTVGSILFELTHD